MPASQQNHSWVQLMLRAYFFMTLVGEIFSGLLHPTNIILFFQWSANFSVQVWEMINCYIAPSCWFLCGFGAHWLGRKAMTVSTVDLISSKITDQNLMSSKSMTPKLKSIKQHHLHRSYPRRLRSNNVFVHRSQAPSLDQQRTIKMKFVTCSSTCTVD